MYPINIIIKNIYFDAALVIKSKPKLRRAARSSAYMMNASLSASVASWRKHAWRLESLFGAIPLPALPWPREFIRQTEL